MKLHLMYVNEIFSCLTDKISIALESDIEQVKGEINCLFLKKSPSNAKWINLSNLIL